MKPPAHAAIVLAAGASRRLGRPKQLLAVHGEPLLRRAVRCALATAPAQTLVVVGAQAGDIFAAVADLGVQRVDCPGWSEGLAASLRAGLAALREDIAGALVVLCDQPALSATHLQTLCASWRETPQGAAASRYADVLGVPAVLPRAWFGELMALRGDAGARALLRERAHLVVPVAAPALAVDIDRPEDCN